MIVRALAPRVYRQVLAQQQRQALRWLASTSTISSRSTRTQRRCLSISRDLQNEHVEHNEAEEAFTAHILSSLQASEGAQDRTLGSRGDQERDMGESVAVDAAYVQQLQQEQQQYTRLDDYSTRNHLIHTQHTLGGDVADHYQPRNLLQNPPGPDEISLELLMASQAHLGHSTSLWNPRNSRYIFGIRQGIHIISLDVTAAHLRRAAKIVEGVTERGGIVLFVGTRKGQARTVVRAAELADPACHLFSRWVPGSITNGQQILGKCAMKVVDEADRVVAGFDEQLLDRPVAKPDLVVCLNPLENYVLLHECGLAGIPTVGIIDTDADPTWVTYPIPANDDSLRCTTLIAGVLGRAGQQGHQKRLKEAEAGNLSFTPARGLTPPAVSLASAAAVEGQPQVEAEAEGELDARAEDDGDSNESISKRQADAQEVADEQGPSVVR